MNISSAVDDRAAKINTTINLDGEAASQTTLPPHYTPPHTQQQRRILIRADPPPGPVLHDVADGRKGDAVEELPM